MTLGHYSELYLDYMKKFKNESLLIQSHLGSFLSHGGLLLSYGGSAWSLKKANTGAMEGDPGAVKGNPGAVDATLSFEPWRLILDC
jgi:hypothetical protein